MNELDRKIKEALSREEAELFEEFGKEPSIPQMLLETFAGRHRWINIYGAIVTVLFVIGAIYSGIQFFSVEDTRTMLMWAVAVIVCVSCISMLKIWYWLEMQKNAVTREVKRLELQIAHLSRRLKQ